MINHKTKKALETISLELVLGLIVSISFLGVFAKLSDELLENELKDFDTVITNIVYKMETPWLTDMMIVFTHIGGTYTYIGIVLIGLFILLRKQLKWESFILVMTILGAWGLNEALKAIFKRARPDIQHLVEVGGYSFPSGHAMVSFATYGILGYLLVIHLRRKKKSYLQVILSTCLLVFLIGFSRIYLHVHYPSDVIAGFSAGGVWLMTCIYAHVRLNKWMELRKER